MKIKIEKTVAIGEHEDTFYVHCGDHQGRCYYHPHRFVNAAAAAAFAGKVLAAGEIDPLLWDGRTPYGSEAWLIDGCEEREIEDERNPIENDDLINIMRLEAMDCYGGEYDDECIC